MSIVIMTNGNSRFVSLVQNVHKQCDDIYGEYGVSVCVNDSGGGSGSGGFECPLDDDRIVKCRNLVLFVENDDDEEYLNQVVECCSDREMLVVPVMLKSRFARLSGFLSLAEDRRVCDHVAQCLKHGHVTKVDDDDDEEEEDDKHLCTHRLSRLQIQSSSDEDDNDSVDFHSHSMSRLSVNSVSSMCTDDCQQFDPTRYKLVRALQTTLFGRICLSKDTVTNENVAVKVSDASKHKHENNDEDPVKEISILGAVAGHRNIVRLLNAGQNGDETWTILEYVSGGELFEHIATKGRVTETVARKYFKQLCSAVQHIHENGYAHMDISLENILLTKSCDEVKICDFGMALPLGKHKDSTPGKITYQAPEVYAHQEFDAVECDAYSLGVCLFVMLCGVPPYKKPDKSDARFRKIVVDRQLAQLLHRWGIKLSDDAVDLIQRVMTMAVDGRLAMDDIVCHPWMTKTMM